MIFTLNSTKTHKKKLIGFFQMVKVVDHIPKKFFQHVEGTDGIFEIRVEFESNIYRILCFLTKEI